MGEEQDKKAVEAEGVQLAVAVAVAAAEVPKKKSA
jgi:hypothetical protein